MAQVNLLTGYPVFDPGYAFGRALDGTIAPPTATTITVSNAPGFTVVFTGGFTVSGNAVTGGMVTGYDVYAGHTLVAAGNNYTIEAGAFFTALQGYGTNPTPLQELVFANVYTKVVGSDLVDDIRAGEVGGKLLGRDGDDILSGGAGADIIKGGKGADDIAGEGGSDYLYGGQGKDTFFFRLNPASPADGVDKIKDFKHGPDTIGLLLHNVTGIAPGELADANFHKGTAATTAEQIIIYDKSTGRLFFDTDGNGAGAQVEFAKVKAGTKLHADDFFAYPPALLV